MAQHRPLRALGLMSGTSLDGIDAALIESDGKLLLQSGAVTSAPYDSDFRQRLRNCLGRGEDAPGVSGVATELTLRHAEVVARLLADNGLSPEDIDLIGFHGHTTVHRPAQRLTVQIGDSALLAARTGIKVVGDFRLNDVSKGGQGAPLAPLYHLAMTNELEKPLAVLNVGGVANVTWIGKSGNGKDPEILAFDTGPGNALIDDWVVESIGNPMDEDGRLARAGTLDQGVLLGLPHNPYFSQSPPKSLDRDDFAYAIQSVSGLSAADGAATLSAFSVAAIVKAREHFPEPVKRWLVCGGGRLNINLLELMARSLGVPVEPVEAVDLDGDALEAQAFAFLAIRSFYGMPLSLPKTTGVPQPLIGGILYNI
jgi:anhydro-N-acetylmuramic acid kinase